MLNTNRKKSARIAIGVGVPLCAVMLAFACFYIQNTPPCIFYEVTGLYCAGCGAGRSLLALLRGDFYAAFRFQPLMFILLPFVSYYCLKQYIAFVFQRDVLPFPRVKSSSVGIIVLIIIIAFWILRNIPIFPFDLLAPTSV